MKLTDKQVSLRYNYKISSLLLHKHPNKDHDPMTYQQAEGIDPIDVARLALFRDFVPPAELRSILEEASSSLAREIDLMRALQLASSWRALRAAAHRIRGSMAGLGCDRLAGALAEFEAKLAAGSVRNSDRQYLDQIEHLAIECVNALKAQADLT